MKLDVKGLYFYLILGYKLEEMATRGSEALLEAAHVKRAKDMGFMAGLGDIGLDQVIPDDIQGVIEYTNSWFDPTKNWRLNRLSAGFVDKTHAPMFVRETSKQLEDEESAYVLGLSYKSNDPEFYGFGSLGAIIRGLRVKYPITLSGHLNAYVALTSEGVRREFADSFDDNPRDYIDFIEGKKKFALHPTHMGPVYTLEQAQKEVSSHYYLLGVALMVPKEGKSKPKNNEVMVEIVMGDLGNRLRIGQERANNVMEQLKKLNDPNFSQATA